MKTRLLSALALSVLATGCASIVNESNQPIKVETLKADGAEVKGAECRLSNDYGTVNLKSGEQGLVHRSSKDLDIVCVDPANPDAKARAISRANGGMFGNILFGGGIGAIIDHNKGTAYTYPTWVQLQYGKTLVFDRRDEKEGAAVAGVDAAASAVASK